MLFTPQSKGPAVTKVTEAHPASWGIQVGAYATRKATEQAIRDAIKRAPALLKNATAIITPLPQKSGTVYRARLAGLEAADARKACTLLSHCLTVPPGT
jgi:D-alanyl-D-alanine carboxypeptidase